MYLNLCIDIQFIKECASNWGSKIGAQKLNQGQSKA